MDRLDIINAMLNKTLVFVPGFGAGQIVSISMEDGSGHSFILGMLDSAGTRQTTYVNARPGKNNVCLLPQASRVRYGYK